jgi:hypothetical protein
LFVLECFAESRHSGLGDIEASNRVVVCEGLNEMFADEPTPDDSNMTLGLEDCMLLCKELGKILLEIADVGLQLGRLSRFEKVDFGGGC